MSRTLVSTVFATRSLSCFIGDRVGKQRERGSARKPFCWNRQVLNSYKFRITLINRKDLKHYLQQQQQQQQQNKQLSIPGFLHSGHTKGRFSFSMSSAISSLACLRSDDGRRLWRRVEVKLLLERLPAAVVAKFPAVAALSVTWRRPFCRRV